jgi:AAA family ATP:ADP antiporter
VSAISRVRGWIGVGRSELPFALLMLTQFFLIITTFWILKPLKKALFIEFYDEGGLTLLGVELGAAEAELIAKVANMVVAAAAVTVFTVLSRTLRRARLEAACASIFLLGFVAFAFWLQDPSDSAVWSFYLFGDLFTTMMVAAFFAFLNDSVTSDGAKRIYGLVGLGGVMGGAFGSLAVSSWIDTVGIEVWLAVAGGAVVLVVGLAVLAERSAAGLGDPPTEEPVEDEPSGGNPAIEGARLVLRSRYLLAVVAIVGLYEIISTIMDFQFTSAVAHYLDGDAIGQQFSLVYAITNGLALGVQLFLTGPVMRSFGVGAALLVLPVATFAGSAAFLVLPGLGIGSLLNTADNAFAYSIHQSAKEALYVPTTRAEKYRAKAFIDMFVQRFAKALAVVLSLAIGAVFESYTSVRWLSAFTLPLIAAWVLAVRYAGRSFESREQDRASAPAAVGTQG